MTWKTKHGYRRLCHSDGSAARTYTYVADAVAGMFLAATKGKKHWYNIAAPDNLITVRELAGLIAGLDPEKKVKVCYDGAAAGGLQYLPFRLGVMNVDRILALGWHPQVGLREAFQYTLESFMQRK